MAALAIAESSAQSADLNLQIRFFDECLRPGSGDQLFLTDYLTGVLDQSGQDVEGATAKPHWLVALEQKPLCCEESVWAERNGWFAAGSCPRLSHDRVCPARPEAASPR
jgi:hypothetical protein